MASRILEFALLISLINIIIFYTVPSDLLSLNLNNFQIWQLITFHFAHFSSVHLLQNIIGLAIASAVAVELKLDFRKFLLAYFFSIFIILPVLLFFPDSAIAGNSTGIYGVISVCLLKAGKFLQERITIPIFIVFIFFLSISSFITCGNCALKFFKTDIFHFAGFLGGLIIGMIKQEKVTRKTAKKKKR